MFQKLKNHTVDIIFLFTFVYGVRNLYKLVRKVSNHR